MSGLDKDRFRNKTVCFRASPEERQRITAKVMVSGLPKGAFILKSILECEINITVGKYQSDRLSVELKRLGEAIKEESEKYDSKNLAYLVSDVQVLLSELLCLVQKGGEPVEMKHGISTEKK